MYRKHTGLVIVFSIILVLSFVVTACAPAASVERPVVKIAFLGPLTGQNAAMGTGGLNSVSLAV